jgi:hypothetical protein
VYYCPKDYKKRKNVSYPPQQIRFVNRLAQRHLLRLTLQTKLFLAKPKQLLLMDSFTTFTSVFSRADDETTTSTLPVDEENNSASNSFCVIA